ncbi:hypothetical protein Goklo_025471 [Gossypium klotzschianum]|uniref:Gag-pol polyprotein n=1 Tax=Gossypium klotzschianum TaxID=34286 RepID=A0A7J8W4V9_9ROSI|nr:hypothetical protein [Gossypium klotzschianum]
MKAYIKSIDEKAWCAMLIGWEAPKMDDNNGKVTKLEMQWTTEEEKLANAISDALYVIFCRVDMQEFKRIAKCIVAM